MSIYDQNLIKSQKRAYLIRYLVFPNSEYLEEHHNVQGAPARRTRTGAIANITSSIET